MLLVLPLAGGVTEVGAKAQVTPAGSPVQDRPTAAVEAVDARDGHGARTGPALDDAERAGRVGDGEVGTGALPQPGNLNEPMRVLQLKLPVVFRYSFVYQNVQSSTGSIVIAL